MNRQEIKAIIIENKVLTESNEFAKKLYDKSRFGVLKKSLQLELTLIEALYLHESEKITIYSGKKPLEYEKILKKFAKIQKNFITRYAVYKDLRDKGYLVNTALKFGAEFRVYDKGIKPGQDHAKWIVFPVDEADSFSWYEFSAKNRVAHSTKKRLMIGIVDGENDVTYYEIKWERP